MRAGNAERRRRVRPNRLPDWPRRPRAIPLRFHFMHSSYQTPSCTRWPLSTLRLFNRREILAAMGRSMLWGGAVAALRTGSSSEEEEAKLIISPPLNGDSGTKMVVKNGTKFTLSCIYDHHGHSSERVHWQNENGKEIDDESSASVFTLGLRERNTHNYKRLLVFRAIGHRDAGRYRCVAATDENSKEYDLSVNVDIVVVDPCKWVDSDEQVGAMEGGMVQVDCSAEGKPEARISITDEDGAPLSDDRYHVAGSQVTIDPVDRENDQDSIVQCVASQVFDDLGYTNVEVRKVSIDVWFAPEFTDDEIDRHGIADRNGSLICNVSDSNPPATDFQFFKGDDELADDSSKYRLEVNEDKQFAILHIKKVTDEDYGKYRCTVSNGKTSASQIINLMKAFPPDEVKASLEQTRADSLQWKLEASTEDSQLPVTELRVHYVRKQLIEDAVAGNFQELADTREAVWAKEGRVKHLEKSDDDVYEIEGLRPATEYVFRFQAVNQAGWGEPVEITAETSEVNPSDDDATDGASALSSTAAMAWVLIGMLLTVVFDGDRRV
uniref:Uncharacterized protein n=1 Tax=Plectus sambesii TaxID=2011161 RepID=A0A914XM74_9BILA